MAKINLGVHLNFLTTRYNNPSEWMKIVAKEFKLKKVQFVSDLIEPGHDIKTIEKQIKDVNFYKKKYKIEIDHSISSSRHNYFGHYDKNVRKNWLDWFKKFLSISKKIGCKGAGSMLGILTFEDLKNNYNKQLDVIVENWIELSNYGKSIGLEYLFWEPMSIKREFGDTIIDTKKLITILNKKSKIPILLNLDVDHGNHFTKNKNDRNPYSWLKEFIHLSPCVHIKQKTKDIYTHKPFIKKYNKIGIIKPRRIIDIISKNKKIDEVTLYFEFGFRERDPYDNNAIKDIKESIQYWNKFLN